MLNLDHLTLVPRPPHHVTTPRTSSLHVPTSFPACHPYARVPCLPTYLGTPVLNLDFLLEEVIQLQKPIDWAGFEARQEAQPLRVVASGLHSEQA